MANRANVVNLDAMIPREDFALGGPTSEQQIENVSTIAVRDFASGSLISPILRKPDFQRETNHWSPEQVASLLECFVNGDLIPSVILWRSPQYLFVIDGGHRLSALRAWVQDDYGDGPISQAFFTYTISEDQKRAAKITRELVATRIGSYQHIQSLASSTTLTGDQRKLMNTVGSRGIPIQWVAGNAEKAEASFFKINTKGTPLDGIEELLLLNRKRPIAIASRAIIRAGAGHKYWSSFPTENSSRIEKLAGEIHRTLFEPELKTPIKTLDLPLGGSVGVRAALQTLIDFVLVASRNQQGAPKSVADLTEDVDGSATITVLTKALDLARRITGNHAGSLGLHPAVYFYGPTGRHLGPMFMGVTILIARKLSENNDSFFKTFTKVRAKLEKVLITHKELVATIVQKPISSKRALVYATLIDKLVDALADDREVREVDLVDYAGLTGRLFVGKELGDSQRFSEDAKSATFIRTALTSAIACPICSGYLDPAKSVSYDHVTRVSEGGSGSEENCQLTHPYCNSGIKG